LDLLKIDMEIDPEKHPKRVIKTQFVHVFTFFNYDYLKTQICGCLIDSKLF